MLTRLLLSAIVAYPSMIRQVSGSDLCEVGNISPAALTCEVLRHAYPDVTFFPNSTEYAGLNEDYYTAAEWLGPACIFAPTTAEDMGFAVKTLVKTVYQYLEPFGLTVVGGRMGVVGIPGFLLGGGISFFGNEYGWASANVASAECVLADGSVVRATASNEYSGLFWALRGGGNSFAIVTEFELKNIEAPAVTVGQASYGTGLRDEYIDSVFGFAFDGVLDRKAAIVPMATWTASLGDEPVYASMLFYNGNITTPLALANFTGPEALLKPSTSTFACRTMANWSNETKAGFDQVHGMQFRFHILSILASKEAMGIIHDTFFTVALQRLSNVTDALGTLVMMPISESYITSTRGDDRAGDPMGIDATKAPYVWVNEVINEKLAPLDVVSPYLYLNDADKGQLVFEGYAPENVARLKRIRAKYDPTSIYTNQMSGGFKIAP
ncbi:FAD binding domain-containing protein [Pleurostoma richardsiae]|uniref:FAD binding domain-containing protein n=1 Tax=Pleurostoma richardsiae TaxID=41990 RepID=A0AA38RM92_9PEZI|nr:FAD binding domain-containing protein [Pleurostoma richardsiae]